MNDRLMREYEGAVRLARAYMPDPRRQTEIVRAVRVWTVAWAVVADAGDVGARVSAELGELHGELVTEIAAALRTIVEHEPERSAWPAWEDRGAWRARVWRAVRGAPNGERVCDVIAWRGLRREEDWRAVALAAHGCLAAGERLVVFGLGANGAVAARALAEAGAGAVACDDRAEAPSPLQRIGREALGPGDVVLVTPDDRAAIEHALEKALVKRVLRPEALWFAQRGESV